MDKLLNLDDKGMLDVKIILLTGAKNHLGISNLPNEADLIQICAFLKNNYPDFTAKEIDDAIQRYARGSIAVNSKPYGVLSTMFLSDVLNEYRTIRKTWRDFERRQQENQLLLAQPVKDEAETNKILAEWLIDWVAENKTIPPSYDWDGVFKHLENIREIELSKEDKSDFFNNEAEGMRESIAFYKNVTGKKAEMMELLRILQDRKLMQSYCRRKLVHLYLNNKILKTTNGKHSRKNETDVQ